MALFELDHFHEILQTLRRNRLRTLLTACGIFWGVFMLVLMLGFGRGMEKAAEEDMGFFAINNIGFRGENTSKPFAGQQAGRRVWLTLDDVEAVRQVPGVDVAFGRNHQGGSSAARGDKQLDVMMIGDYPEGALTERSVISQGRALNVLDMKEARKVAVIGTKVKEVLFGSDTDPIGGTIQINKVTFQVVGVLDMTGFGAGGQQRDFMNSRVFVPRPALARLAGMADRINVIPVLLDGSRPSIEVEDEVKAMLKARHGVAPDDERAVMSFNREKSWRRFQNLFFAIRALCWVVGTLTLMAGAIGVSNIMMIAVAERTREIGIRKALGATPFSIMSHIVAEATILTGMAGYLGLCAGVAVLQIAAGIVGDMPVGSGPRFFSRPELDLNKAILAAVVLTVAGALAGLAPARAATAVRPIEALAHE